MCSFNGADPAQCESPYTVDGLAPGRARVRGLRHPPDVPRHLRGAGGAALRAGRGHLRVDGRRHDAARHGDHVRPARDDRQPERVLRRRLERRRRRDRVLARLRGLRQLRGGRGLRGPAPRRARPARACRRPGRERRPDPGRVPLDDRAWSGEHAGREQRRAQPADRRRRRAGEALVLPDQHGRRDRARRAQRRPADRAARLRRRALLRPVHERRVRRARLPLRAVQRGRLRRRPRPPARATTAASGPTSR